MYVYQYEVTMYINSLNSCNVHPKLKFKLTVYILYGDIYNVQDKNAASTAMNSCSGIVLKLDYDFKDMLVYMYIPIIVHTDSQACKNYVHFTRSMNTCIFSRPSVRIHTTLVLE